MLMNAINFVMDAGSSVFMPLIILILGLIFGLKFAKAFKAGVVVGIGFIGINLVLGILGDNLMVVINRLVELYNFKLTSIDVGWTIGATIAWSTGIIVPIILVSVFVVNIILILVGFTKTLDVDIWNYWGALFVGNAIYLTTGNMAIGVIAAVVATVVMLKMADYAQPKIEEAFQMPGMTVCNMETVSWAIIGAPLNKLIDKIPVINKIDWTPEKIQNKLGTFGEPWFMGGAIGLILSLFARLDAQTVLQVMIHTAAAMFLLPKMIGVLMEGLMPITEAAKYIQRDDVVSIAKSTVFNCKPDALCVSGLTAGVSSDAATLRLVKEAVPETVVFANTGVRPENVEEQLSVADGAVTGTTFKRDGKFENEVDEARVKYFMDKVKAFRKG